jgi:predicted ribosome quality control (RQC) complex YloA/Tae2 family protein
MAFTRATLRNLAKESGVELPKEFEDALISEHTTARDAYAEEQVKAELAKQPTEKAGNVKDSDEYKALKQSFDDYKAEVAAKETKAKKEAAYRAILKDANLSEKGIEKAIKYAEWDKIELEADGKLKGASDHIKAVKEEWAEYVTTTTTTGAKTSNPPSNTGSGTGKTRDEIIAIRDGATRRAEMAKNAHLFPELAAANK